MLKRSYPRLPADMKTTNKHPKGLRTDPKKADSRKRKKERRDFKFKVHFHSNARVVYFRNLPCEVTGKRDVRRVQNAHTRGGGVGGKGPYTSIVPLLDSVHHDFDTMPEAKFNKKYGRTKASIRERAEFYHRQWEAS